MDKNELESISTVALTVFAVIFVLVGGIAGCTMHKNASKDSVAIECVKSGGSWKHDPNGSYNSEGCFR